MNWICKNCETKNESHQNCCYVCGALRDEVKSVDFDEQDGADKRNLARKTQYECEEKPRLRSPIVITLLALMIFGLLFVGIRFVGRFLDGAATEPLEAPGNTQEHRNPEQGEILWHDVFLEDGIRKALGKGEGENVTLADTAEIYALSIVGDTVAINDDALGISCGFDRYTDDEGLDTWESIPQRTVSLNDLPRFPNLKTFTLVASAVEEIDALESCKQLEVLTLSGSGISDGAIIASLDNLQSLYLVGDALDNDDMRSIGTLTKLIHFGIDLMDSNAQNNSQITSLSFLQNFSNLESLVLRGFHTIEDFSPLSSLERLKELDLCFTEISNIQVLSQLKELEKLDLCCTSVTEIQALSNLTNLTDLDLSHTAVLGLQVLTNLTSLRKLDLSYLDYDFSNLKFLAKLVDLRELNLSVSNVSDIRVLSNLTELRELNLLETNVSDIRVLANLSNLAKLNLSMTDVSDIRPLSNLTNLAELDISEMNVADIRAVSNLTNLTKLILCGTSVIDLQAVSNLKNLEILCLESTGISDLSPLEGLKKLKELCIAGSPIQDVSPLKGLPLQYIFVGQDSEHEQELREMFSGADVIIE
ncbi:MAG: leucine-rich repeat domain-containing protein [Petrimonas sp.]|nr:leucine-rich repeat domain-containing protein [Petrimonas sp.]